MTCLCLTRNRRQWLPEAIACFQAQTYPDRELLIVADGEPVRDLVPDDPSVRLIEIAEGYTIGQKRNFGVSRAAHPIIAHWDDDDYSAPGRLADQLGRLLSSGLAVTGYHSMRFVGAEASWQYRRSASHYALGTSLCYRREWALAHPFPSLQIGEDNEFGSHARAARQMITADAATPDGVELMYATVHEGNTSPKQTAAMVRL